MGLLDGIGNFEEASAETVAKVEAQNIEENQEPAPVEKAETPIEVEIPKTEEAEAKKAEVEDSSLKNEKVETPEDTKVVEEESRPSKPTVSEYETWAAENNFISPEELEDRLEEARNQDKLSPTLKKYRELESQGHDITSSKFLSKLNADYSKLDPYNKDDAMALLVTKMKDDTGLSSSKASERLKLKYDELFSGDFEPEDREYQRALVRFEEDAVGVKKDLEASKIEISRSQVQNNEPTEQEIADYKKTVTRARVQFEREIKGVLNNNKKIVVNYDDNTIELDLNSDEMARISSKITQVFDNNPANWLGENGLDRSLIKEDEVNSVIKQFVRLDDNLFERIITKAAENSRVDGVKSQIEESKNSKPPAAQTPQGGRTETQSEREAKEYAKIPKI